MLPEILKNKTNVIISTGNILNVIKKAAQKPTEELIDCLNSTLSAAIIDEDNSEISITKPNITRQNDDLLEKLNENERVSVKIGAKIFLNNDKEENLKSAIENVFNVLNIDYLDNLILAYHPKTSMKLTNGHSIMNGGSKDGNTIEWGGGDFNSLSSLKKLWSSLEKYKLDKKIEQLGIADLDYESLKELYSNCKISPTIAQINLSTCCVVPPPLQTFCNEHDIQLLTHSDPEEILTEDALMNELKISTHHPSWIIRYQVHVKCRGVLSAKGYVVGMEKN